MLFLGCLHVFCRGFSRQVILVLEVHGSLEESEIEPSLFPLGSCPSFNDYPSVNILSITKQMLIDKELISFALTVV